MKVLPSERAGTETTPSQGVSGHRAKISALQTWGRRWARRYEGPFWLKPALLMGYRRTIEAVLHSVDLERSHRVLDLAAGTGIASRMGTNRLAPGGVVIALDISREMIEQGRRFADGTGLSKILWILAEASQLPLRDSSVDAIVSTGAFHLLPRPQTSLREMARVLKPGGKMALHSAPRRFPYTLIHRLLRRDLRAAVDLHTRSELQTWAEEAGFTDVGVDPVPFGWLLRGTRP